MSVLKRHKRKKVYDLKCEQWKPIKGFEGLYEVSNCGRVRSKKRNTTNGRILSGSKRKENGYITVILFSNGKGAGKLIHRLVAEAFIPNPENKPDVNHIDGNKQNNCVENLGWVTPSENQRHSIKIGLRRGSILQDGGYLRTTKDVNERIDKIVLETGLEKWEVANFLLIDALDTYERNRQWI